MAKKREFASDSEVSKFITRRQKSAEVQTEKNRQQVSIYPDKDVLDKVKILAKMKDMNLNSMLLTLITEAMAREDYQKMIRAYEQMQELML